MKTYGLLVWLGLMAYVALVVYGYLVCRYGYKDKRELFKEIENREKDLGHDNGDRTEK